MNPGTSLLMHLKLHEAHQKHLLSHIHYTVHGPDLMTEQTITYILVHGNRSSSHYWEPFQKYLHALKDVRTVAVDLRGYGKSSHMPKVESLDDFSDDVHKIILEVALHEEHKVEEIKSRYILVGWSLGGLVVMNLAAKYPQYYQRLFLVAPVSFSGYPYMQVDKNGQLTDQKCQTRQEVENLPAHLQIMQSINNKDLTFLKSLAETKQYNAGLKPSDHEIQLLLQQSLLQTNFLDAVWILHSTNIKKQVVDNLTGPVLIYHGKQDLVVPIEDSIEMFNVLGDKRCKLVAADNVGHVPLISTPKELAEELIKFSDQSNEQQK